MTADKSFLASSLAIVRIVVQIFQRGQMAPVTKNNYDNNFSLFFLNESTYLASVIESIALGSTLGEGVEGTVLIDRRGWPGGTVRWLTVSAGSNTTGTS